MLYNASNKHTGNLSTERRAVDCFSFVFDVDVILARRQSPVNDVNFALLLLLLEYLGLSRSVDFNVDILYISNQPTSVDAGNRKETTRKSAMICDFLDTVRLVVRVTINQSHTRSGEHRTPPTFIVR